jgi:hypothetical protein
MRCKVAFRQQGSLYLPMHGSPEAGQTVSRIVPESQRKKRCGRLELSIVLNLQVLARLCGPE